MYSALLLLDARQFRCCAYSQDSATVHNHCNTTEFAIWNAGCKRTDRGHSRTWHYTSSTCTVMITDNKNTLFNNSIQDINRKADCHCESKKFSGLYRTWSFIIVFTSSPLDTNGTLFTWALCIPNLGTTLRLVVIFMPQVLHPWYPLNRRVGGPPERRCGLFK